MRKPRTIVLLAGSLGCNKPELKGCDTGCDSGEVQVVDDGPWDPLVLGNRGSGVTTADNPYAENTIRSIQQALASGADGVEVDVHQTSDGVLVLVQDELLDENTSCTGCVVSMSSVELSECQAISGTGQAEAIPTLQQAMEAFTEGYFSIEIRAPESCLGSHSSVTDYVEASAQSVVDIVAATSSRNRVQISSFDRAAVRLIENIQPNLHTALLWTTGDVLAYIDDALWAGADTLTGHGLVVEESVAEAVRQSGLEMWLWGIELSSDVTRVSQWEPGAMITDHPGIVRQTVTDMGFE